MSEALLGESIDVVSELSLELAKQLGGEAVQAAFLQEKIEAMSPAARINAINHLAGLVTSLETVRTEDVIDITPTPTLIEHSIHLVEAPEKDLAVAEIALVDDSEVVQEPVVADAEVVVSGVERLAHKNAQEFARKLFGNEVAFELTESQVPKLLETVTSLYMPKNYKQASAKRQIERLQPYLEGVSGASLAQRFGMTQTGVSLGRKNIITILQREYDTETLQSTLMQIIATPSEESAVEKRIMEPGEGLEKLDSTTESSITERILAEHGVSDKDQDQEKPRDPKEVVLEQAGQLWEGDKELLASLEALLEQRDVSPAQADARQELKSLMHTFAPRWYPKLGIKQDSWNITANILGLQNPRVLSLADAKSRYGGRLSLNKSSVENELLAMITFLFDKQLSGAEPAPETRNVASQQSFLAQRPTRR